MNFRPGTRVVHVCLDPGIPVFGAKGCSVHVQEVLRVMVAAGADVHVVAARVGGAAPQGLSAVTVHELGRPQGEPADRERRQVALDATAADLVADLLTGTDPGTALVYERHALFAAAVAERCRRLGVRHVLEVNAPLVEEHATHRGLVHVTEAREASRRALRATSRVVAVSSAVAEFVRSSSGVEALVVPNGVDVQRFRPAPTDPAPGATPAEFDVAFVGAFRPWHGLDVLLEAATRLRDLPGKPVRLRLIGDGPGRADVLDRAAAAGIACTATGALPPADVPAALSGARAAVAPYPRGAAYFSPLKVAEYLAAGIPTVAGAVGDLARSYRDGHELLLVEPGDAAALTAALQRIRTEPVLAAGLAAAGRRAAVERFSWTGVVRRSLADVPAPDGAEVAA
ncbi:glycosyltransferase family 4 protein [Kineococcus gynurae]|uniref:Glycosyltransferase family 4 protein n=1 Tax=Kineococcus gynurae TaxID=452979 RepID=A0ABV5LXD4_9ACTN